MINRHIGVVTIVITPMSCLVVCDSDVGRVVETMYGSKQPPCVLIGHSMGGAVAVHTSYDQHMGGQCSPITPYHCSQEVM